MKRLLFLLIVLVVSANALTQQEETDFITTITSGNLADIRAKLDKGFSPNYQFTLMGFRGHTPLTIALMKDIPNYEYRNNAIQLKGMKPNAVNHIAVYELLASRAKPEEVQKLATELPKLKESKELDLFNAIQRVDLTAVKKAVERGARLAPFAYLRGKVGFTPLQYAYGKDAKHKEIMEYLLSQGADASVLDGAILAEAVDGDIEMVRWLLAYGAKDKNNAALNEVTALAQEAKDDAKKVVYEQIKEVIRNSNK